MESISTDGSLLCASRLICYGRHHNCNSSRGLNILPQYSYGRKCYSSKFFEVLMFILDRDVPFLYREEDLEDKDGSYRKALFTTLVKLVTPYNLFDAETKRFSYLESEAKDLQPVSSRTVRFTERTLSTSKLTWTVRCEPELKNWVLRSGSWHISIWTTSLWPFSTTCFTQFRKARPGFAQYALETNKLPVVFQSLPSSVENSFGIQRPSPLATDVFMLRA